MLLRSKLAFVAACMLVITLGCAAEKDQATELRSLVLEHDGSWIGNAVCYGPHRDGQEPGGASPTAEELAEDLSLMSLHWNLLRTYSAGLFSETLLELIRANDIDMKVVLGAWIGIDANENDREVAEAVRLAALYPDIVVAVCVSNETQVFWSPYPLPLEQLIPYIRKTREQVQVPVTVADDFNYWNKVESRALAAEIDFLLVHAHPLWNGIQLENALPWLQEQLQAVQAMHLDRPVVVGETGWATQVHDEGEQAELIKGIAGESEQKFFYDAVQEWARRERQGVFIFEAFDENWKGGPHPNEVEKHWGVFNADRSPKTALAEPSG